MLIPAGIGPLKADVGAFGVALGGDADLLGYFMVDAGHMFHYVILIGL